MRRKKHKHTRRSMAFYKMHFGFREPFKVLLDGNFIHAALAANMTNLQGLLDNLLGGPTKLFTPRCVGAELRALGPDFKASAAAAKSHALHHCGHDPPLASASDCIAEQVGAANAGRWVVATQDKALQAALAKVPGAPLVFASVNGVHLADPPEGARALAESGAKAAQALPLHELGSEALRDLPLLRPRDEGYKKFRRKRAAGPNPLSVRKSKKKAKAGGAPATAAAAAAAAGEANGGGGGGEAAAAAAEAEAGGGKRKRKKKKAAPSAAASGDGGGSA